MFNNGYIQSQITQLAPSNIGYYSHSPLQVVESGVKTPGLMKGTV